MPDQPPTGLFEMWATPVGVFDVTGPARDPNAVIEVFLARIERPAEARAEVCTSPMTLHTGQGICLGANGPGWSAVAYLTVQGAPRHNGGGLQLHDPRPATMMTEMPGLPWGRPMTVPPSPGTIIIFPGWMGWSILPVEEDQRVDLLVLAHAAGRPPGRGSRDPGSA